MILQNLEPLSKFLLGEWIEWFLTSVSSISKIHKPQTDPESSK